MGLFSRSSSSSQHKPEKKLKEKKSSRKLRKLGPPGIGANEKPKQEDGVPQISELEAHNARYRELHGALDTQRGERRDDTGLLHSMVVHDIDFDDFTISQSAYQETRPPGEHNVASLSPDLWEIITSYLPAGDAASLAFSSKTLLRRLGLGPWDRLEQPHYHQDRIEFLMHMDCYLPNHLLCFPCAKYHVRTQRGQETIKPPNILNPLFTCPNATNTLAKPPRIRLTPGHRLSYNFVQLGTRALRYGPQYGVTLGSLARRWKKDGWSHTTKYHFHNGHLMLRVVSSTSAHGGMQSSAMRKLLFCRDDDYFPYFSVCAHWKDGELMNLCKCALTHIPEPKDEGGLIAVRTKIKENIGLAQRFDPNALITQCGHCRPMRRCPECPTEYLIEVRLMEDRATHSFKQSIVVSRWSDLGDGKSPLRGEWAACNGDLEGYDSFGAAGKRGISGTFEAAFTEDHVPGQRCLSINPKGKKASEKKEDWF